jgi:hypothetical protein
LNLKAYLGNKLKVETGFWEISSPWRAMRNYFAPLQVRTWIILGLLLAGGWTLAPKPALADGPAFHSILVKNLNQLTPSVSFSKNDRIYLYTVWTGLTGDHEVKVLWIRPDKKIQETTRLKVKIPPKAQNYTTWAWLSFKKGLLDFMSSDAYFIGSWKARLFLDEKFLDEYVFTVS